MTIISLENDPRVQDIAPGASPLAWAAYLCLRNGKPPPRLDLVPTGEIAAYVNHSRWIAECPFCHNAHLASKSTPMFYCDECLMVWNRGLPVNVRFPAEAGEIESLLLVRPELRNRNWWPFETVEHLAEQNILFGKGA